MSNFVSTLFSTPEEFEAWLKNGEHTNKEALDCLTLQRENEWDKKGCLLDVKDGKLQLLCKDRNVLAEIDICKADGETVIRDMVTGAITVKGIKDKNSGKTFSVWIGTTDAFKKLLVKDPTTVYFFTDDTTLDDIEAEFDAIRQEFTEAIDAAISDLKGEMSMGGIVPLTAESANSAGKAQRDWQNNVIHDTYVTKTALQTSLELTDREIEKITDGRTVVSRAKSDEDGYVIKYNYAKTESLITGDIIVKKAETASRAVFAQYLDSLLEEGTGLFSLNSFRLVTKRTLFYGPAEITENSKTINVSQFLSINYNRLEIVYKAYYLDSGEYKAVGDCIVSFKKYGDTWKRLSPSIIGKDDPGAVYSIYDELHYLTSITVDLNASVGTGTITFDRTVRTQIPGGNTSSSPRFDILQIDGYIE